MKSVRKYSLYLLALLVIPFLSISYFLIKDTPLVKAQVANLSIYDDSLSAGWVSWSWSSNINFANPAPVITGTKSIWWEPYAGWAGLYLHTETAVDTTSYSELHFSLQADHTNQKFQIYMYGENNNQLSDAKSLDNFGGQPGGNVYKNYTIKLSDLNASGKKIKGLAIQDATGQYEFPVFVDNIYLSGGAVATVAPTLVPTPTPTTTATPLATPSPTPIASSLPTPLPSATPTATILPSQGSDFSTVNDVIYKNGTKVNLQGVSWFGFETGTYAPHGLWARNWKEMIVQIKSTGFNAIRVPFCPTTLRGVTPSGIDYSQNKDLVGLNSLQVMDKILNEMNNQGLYILLDHHTPECTSITDLWYTGNYSESTWISDLQFVAKRYANLSNFLGIELKNEPHGSATWGSGNTATDWNLAAERAGKAVNQANPNLLIFVQGIENTSNCQTSIWGWWGGNLHGYTCKPISTASIPANKLVLSTHVYGPDVYNNSYFSNPTFPKNMPTIWESHFGFLTSLGKTVVPTEWGGKYGTSEGNVKDITLQNALTSYFVTKGICNSFYWDWNPNSGDTGGILQDDWKTVWSTKVQLLKSYYNSCN